MARQHLFNEYYNPGSSGVFDLKPDTAINNTVPAGFIKQPSHFGEKRPAVLHNPVIYVNSPRGGQ